MNPDKFETYPLKKLFEFNYPSKFFVWDYDRGILPGFATYLLDHGFTETRKVFSSIGLSDVSTSTAAWLTRKDFSWLITEALCRLIRRQFPMIEPEGKALKNFLKTDTRLCFSANPWDIATMAERGIKSCMSWNSRQSVSLAGSVLDPYCGVIFLSLPSSMRTTYGTRMLARAVVRYVRNDKGIPCLYLEYLYLSDDDRISHLETRKIIAKLFSRYLKKKTGLDVLVSSEDAKKVEIPYEKELSGLPPQYLSYRDSKIPYSYRANVAPPQNN